MNRNKIFILRETRANQFRAFNAYLDMNKNIISLLYHSLEFGRRETIFYRVLYLIKNIRKVLVHARKTFAEAAF